LLRGQYQEYDQLFKHRYLHQFLQHRYLHQLYIDPLLDGCLHYPHDYDFDDTTITWMVRRSLG